MSGGGNGQLIVGGGEGQPAVTIDGDGSITIGESDRTVQMYANPSPGLRVGDHIFLGDTSTITVGSGEDGGTTGSIYIHGQSSGATVLNGAEIYWQDIEICKDGETETIQVLARPVPAN